MKHILYILIVCMGLSCCVPRGKTANVYIKKDTINAFDSTLDLNMELIFINMWIPYNEYKKEGIAGIRPLPSCIDNKFLEDKYIWPDTTDLEWTCYHVNRLIFTKEYLEKVKKDSSQMLTCLCRTADVLKRGDFDTIVNHVVIYCKL